MGGLNAPQLIFPGETFSPMGYYSRHSEHKEYVMDKDDRKSILENCVAIQ